MTSATVAVVCVADPLSDDDLASLHTTPASVLSGGTVLGFPTATAAARTLQDLRTRRPFIRAALDVTEAPLDGARPLLDGLAAVVRCLLWAAASPPGVVLLSDLACQLLTVSDDLRCEPSPTQDGVHRLVPVAQPGQVLPLPRPLEVTDRHPFINRYAPWLALERAWAAVSAGERRVILLEGEAGSGKTRLVAEFARRAHLAGGLVVYGGSTEAVELPFQPFNEALRPAFEQLIASSPEEQLGESPRADLGRLFPWAAPQGSSKDASGPSGRPGLPRGPETERHWAFEAVVDLLAAMTVSAPVLVVLDDLHWAQRPTLRLLDHVVRSPRLERLCLVAAARDAPSDRTDAFASALPTIARLHGVERVDLEPFDEVGVRRFVASATGTLAESLPGPLEPVVRQLTELSAGNAFFLTESWQHLLDSRHVRCDDGCWSVCPSQAAETPRSVREMVGQRLARLDDRARRALQLAACGGSTFDVRLIAAAAGAGVGQVLDAVDEAIGAGLLRDLGAGRVGFVHALVRQSIEDALPTSDRTRCHRAVANALLDTGDAEATVLARHFTAAVPLEPPSIAVHYARLAAQRSIDTVSFDDAIAVLQDVSTVAADDRDRADLLVDLATAYARSGDSFAALRCCEDAAGLARSLGDQGRLVRAARAMSEATWRGALHGGAAVTVLREALATELDPVTRCELLGALSGALALSGADEASREATDEALSLASSLGQPHLLVDAIHSGLYATVTPENVHDQAALSQRGLEIAVREGDDFAELRLIGKVMFRLFVLMDSGALSRYSARYRELVHRFRQPYYLLFQAGYEVSVALCEGHFAEAEAAAEEYCRWGDINHQDDGAYGIQMFSIRREQGRLAELRPLLERSTRLNGDDTAWTPGLAAVYAEVGMADEACVLLDRLAADHLATLPDDSLLPGVMSYLADAAFECGHQEIARQVLSRLEPYRGLAVYVPGLVCYGAADRYVGRLYSTLGQHDAAVAAFDAALELDQRTGWSTWIAHSQFALAQQLATIARRAELERARALLRDAGATAASLGMSALSRRVAALLETLHTTPEVSDGLTRRESEVLGLLCQGKSNRQIGEELHASQHTIAHHVRAILAKTSAANRTEAATWAHRHGGI